MNNNNHNNDDKFTTIKLKIVFELIMQILFSFTNTQTHTHAGYVCMLVPVFGFWYFVCMEFSMYFKLIIKCSRSSILWMSEEKHKISLVFRLKFFLWAHRAKKNVNGKIENVFLVARIGFDQDHVWAYVKVMHATNYSR